MISGKLLIYSLLLFFRTITGCPYESYNDALLPSSYPHDETIIDIKLVENENVNSISVGYWTFCIPYYIPERYPKIE